MNDRGKREPRGKRHAWRNRRWPRLVIPYLAFALLVLGTTVVYQTQQPDPTDTDYLSPDRSSSIGASRLAQRLRERGIVVQRETKSSVALARGISGQVTLFIPTPTLVHPYYLRMLKLLPATTRVVMVAPDATVLKEGRIPAEISGVRLASRAVEPDCTGQAADQFRSAAVFRVRYPSATPVQRCYQGGLTVVTRASVPVTLVGSDDPFRNDRVTEHQNEALGAALLSATPTVIWLDLHRPEHRPEYASNPALASQGPAPPSLGPGSPDPDFELPYSDEESAEADRGDSPSGGAQKSDEASESDPLWQAFPPWVFAVAALVGLSLLLLALARGRRLSAPVLEPLPVVVKTTETVTGRGRLYHRARARRTAATILRANCGRQLVQVLRLEPRTGSEQITMAVAMASGWPPGLVDQVLNGSPPLDDQSLIELAAQTEALLRAVKGDTR